jgi:ABC-type antimicrobial peptide transport system permease subunit
MANEKAQVCRNLSELEGGVFSSDSSNPFAASEIMVNITGDYETYSSSLWLYYGIEIIAYDYGILRLYRPMLNTGRWLDDADNSADYIPAVLTRKVYGIALNDIIELTSQIDNSANVRVKIVGIQSVNIFLDLNKGGSGFSSTGFVEYDNKPRLIVDRDMALMHLGTDSEIKAASKIVMTSDEDVISQLKSYGFYQPLSEIYESGLTDRNNRVLFFVPYIILLSAVSISGLIGCLTLSVIRNMKMFAILMMIGYRITDILKIIVYYLVIICLCSCIFSVIVYFVLGNGGFAIFSLRAMMPGINSYLASVIVLLLVFSTTFIPSSILKKQQLTDTLRRDLQ